MLELFMEYYRKLVFVFCLGVFSKFVNFMIFNDEDFLRVSYISDVVMFVDG